MGGRGVSGTLTLRLMVDEALFPGCSFVDCALRVRKMSSPADMLPMLVKGLGLVQRDVENPPISFDTSFLQTLLKAVPDDDGDPLYGAVPDMVSNTIDPKVYNILIAAVAICAARRLGPSRAAEALRRLSDTNEGLPEVFESLNGCVQSLTSQISFLWHSFHESAPNIATVTRDAFDLVDQTKLQTNLTPDMLDKAFERDMFLELPKPICGFMELAFLRRKGFVYVLVGRRQKPRTIFSDVHGAVPAFLVVRPVSILKQIGSMTEESLSATFDEGLEDIDAYLLDQFERTFGDSPDYEQMRQEAERRLSVDKEEHTPEEMERIAKFVSSAVVFATKLRLMLLVEKPPVEETFSVVGAASSHDGVPMPPGREGETSYSVVSLTKGFREARSQYEKSGGRLDRYGKKVVEKFIAGFIRRQHYGKGNAQVKTIFVAPFTNRFWMNEGLRITRIVK